MCVIAERLPVPLHVSDIRAAMGLPARYWLQRREDPEWMSHVWSVQDENVMLFICFQRLSCRYHVGISDDEIQLIAQTVVSVRRRLTELSDFPSVKQVFSKLKIDFKS